MVGVFLVIQMPDASDKRSVTLRFRPIDCFFLGFESAELMVRMVSASRLSPFLADSSLQHSIVRPEPSPRLPPDRTDTRSPADLCLPCAIPLCGDSFFWA
jgi:hypothetical protein